MLFNSEQYLFFLPLVVAVTWALPGSARPAFLLLASYVFYAAWNPPFLLLVWGMTAANYAIGLLQGARLPRSRWLLVASLIVNLGLLAVFKYLGLIDDSARRVAVLFGLAADLPAVHLVLPLGLSFFTFEFIHYQVDLLRGHPPVRNPVHFALFPAFFPTQIAGPIKRYQDFVHQVEQRPVFDSVRFLEGVELIAIGLFKKVVLADTLLPIAGAVFADPLHATVVDAWIGIIAFSFQIYLDFSGYTDVGRGSAQLLGYTVPFNFRAPYLATSMRDFWRRWHMSLSSWLRDYLYIPLGGNRVSPARNRFNLLATMALGGLWHGAAWHFVVWGSGHGLALITERLSFVERLRLGERLRPIPGWLPGWLATQLIVLSLWSMFRAPGAMQALQLWERLILGGGGLQHVTPAAVARVLIIASGLLGAQIVIPRLRLRERLSTGRSAVFLRPAYVLSLAMVSMLQGQLNHDVHPFIYFQF